MRGVWQEDMGLRGEGGKYATLCTIIRMFAGHFLVLDHFDVGWLIGWLENVMGT